jgi:hypothetical protein
MQDGKKNQGALILCQAAELVRKKINASFAFLPQIFYNEIPLIMTNLKSFKL